MLSHRSSAALSELVFYRARAVGKRTRPVSHWRPRWLQPAYMASRARFRSLSCARALIRARAKYSSLFFRGQIADATIVLAPSLSRSFLSERSTAGLCARHCTYMIIAFCAFQLRFLEAHFRAVPEFPRQTSARVQEHDTNAAVLLRVSWNLKVTERGRVLEPAVPNACACFSRDI